MGKSELWRSDAKGLQDAPMPAYCGILTYSGRAVGQTSGIISRVVQDWDMVPWIGWPDIG